MRTDYPARSTAPRIVVIGGGTGLSTMLRGLKKCAPNLTAIVAVSDDGGGSGMLRRELGMPPPGDIRNCIQALANTEPTMAKLLNYRFSEGSLAGQSFGNLFLAALNGMSDSFSEAVRQMSEVLSITGRVLPVSDEDITLIAEFGDGSVILGESTIAEYKHDTQSVISRLRLSPESPDALPASLEAITRAEMIVLGPGSLYTSVIPNLLTKGISEAIAASSAVKVYVLNVMTQDGETEGYSASEHIRALFSHAGGRRIFDCCLANNLTPPAEVLERYREQGAEPAVIDTEEIEALGVELIMSPVADVQGSLARHNPDLLAGALMDIFKEKSPTRIYGK